MRQEPIKIARHEVGLRRPCYIIFEVASTHENNWKIAKKYVDQAKEVGADALKFQLFEANKLLNSLTPGLKSTYDYFKGAETPRKWFPKLIELCRKARIDLLCTPFDEDAASFLNDTGVKAVKISSGDLTHHQLLAHVAKFKKPVILSTGMATMDEVRAAVNVLRSHGCKQLILLQCTSVYPMPYEDANVRAMRGLKKEFGCLVGYSDNGSKGIVVPLVAVAMGASVIEKHVTSQKQRGSLDDAFSLSLGEFSEMTKGIRQLEKDYKGHLEEAAKDLAKEFGDDVEKVLGDGVKKPAGFGVKREDGTQMTEADERHWARRGVYPNQNIKRGAKITEAMIISLRPDVGVSALSFHEIIGKKAEEDLSKRCPLKIDGDGVRVFKKADIRAMYTDPSEVDFVNVLLEYSYFD